MLTPQDSWSLTKPVLPFIIHWPIFPPIYFKIVGSWNIFWNFPHHNIILENTGIKYSVRDVLSESSSDITDIHNESVSSPHIRITPHPPTVLHPFMHCCCQMRNNCTFTSTSNLYVKLTSGFHVTVSDHISCVKIIKVQTVMLYLGCKESWSGR